MEKIQTRTEEVYYIFVLVYIYIYIYIRLRINISGDHYIIMHINKSVLLKLKYKNIK